MCSNIGSPLVIQSLAQLINAVKMSRLPHETADLAKHMIHQLQKAPFVGDYVSKQLSDYLSGAHLMQMKREIDRLMSIQQVQKNFSFTLDGKEKIKSKVTNLTRDNNSMASTVHKLENSMLEEKKSHVDDEHEPSVDE